ncbi:UbiA prenyltransferase [Neolentinus lepideus HHB14362 ss-1]|uniref:4-hydroxybenzoate polyprenyltransferase, mitochondrial n=1 Tax=Neolentinus lepideus HHB14362 ss-1 TaxID=1314782 RepID=A0A165P4I2_9AGAM|nr:UbiA prenyltransferase [Neolentinus lepideus HHB14362 ss-1]
MPKDGVEQNVYLELIRFYKPTGSILMFWPFAWGLTIAACTTKMPLPDYIISLAKCTFAAFLVRSSACTVNDIFDRKLDSGVERTKDRPLPSGRISVLNAFTYLGLQYLVSIIYFWPLSTLAFRAALVQLFPLFIIYPILKRVTYWPQAWLGLAMNFGIVITYVHVLPIPNYNLLYVMLTSAWCWTMYYDTIYACQDIRDDIKMDIRSTARLFGSRIRLDLIALAAGMMSMLLIAGRMNNQGIAYFLVSIGGGMLHLVWQLSTVDLNDPNSCWVNFKRNSQFGAIVWAGMFLDYYSSGTTST